MKQADKKNLLLVTAGFPYGEWERGFLSTEFEKLTQDFAVTVLSVGRNEPLLYPLADGVCAERFSYKKQKRSIFADLTMLRYLFVPAVFKEVFLSVRKASSVHQAMGRVLMLCSYYSRVAQVRQRMKHLVKERHIDILYTYWATEPAVAACSLRKKFPSLRFVTRFHGHDLYKERNGSNWQPFRHMIADHADRLIFACQAGKDYFIRNWGFQEKTSLHYLGCSASEVCPHEENATLRLVSCSNLIKLKRVDLLINGLSLIPGTVSIRWDHFGDGEEAEKLKQLAAQVLGKNITWNFHGHIANHLLRQHFYQLDPDVFITTSSTEGGVPVSIQEALSVGIPAIGTAVGGIPEAIISCKTGFLLGENPSAQEVADALLQFVALPQDEKHMLHSGAYELWKSQFSAENNAQNFMKELHEILGE